MMTPNVKRSDTIVRISVLLIIGCMVTGGGCSKPTEQSASPSGSDGVLTLEIAEKFVDDIFSVPISKFTSISDAAAEALGNHHGNLALGGLTSLSDRQAEALAKHEGELILAGLTSLSDTQAEALAKHDGNLWLDGLTELSDAQAEALAKHEDVLFVDYAKLPPSASKILKDAFMARRGVG